MKGGGEDRLPKPRASCRMIAALAKDPLWVESLTPEMRESLVLKLRDAVEAAESPREVASVVRAIASLEQNDIARTRLVMEADLTSSEDGMDDARRLRADLDEIDKMEGGKPC